MSCYLITMEQGHKVARPIASEAEYRALRSEPKHLNNLALARGGNDQAKRRLLQFCYSCIPGEDGLLKGSTTPSCSVGMDVDFDPEREDYEELMATAPQRILEKENELGLLMLERSARKGYHLVFARRPELNQEENLRWASDLLGIEFDKAAKDITRVFFASSASADDLLYLSPGLFDTTASPFPLAPSPARARGEYTPDSSAGTNLPCPFRGKDTAEPGGRGSDLRGASYNGLPYQAIINKWWQMYNDGASPVRSNRDVLTYELAVNLRHICGFDRNLMDKVIPCYDEFPHDQKMKCIDSALSEKRTQMPRRLRDVLAAVTQDVLRGTTTASADDWEEGLSDAMNEDAEFYYRQLPKMPLGVRDSIDSAGPSLALPIITAICPAIGALASGVRLDVHGRMNHLNLISYIAGDFASGKGAIDPVVDAWMEELKSIDRFYIGQEEEWRAKKRAAKNKKEQPEEKKLPIRCLTLNNTVANLAERLANTCGKHAFSFTPEADTVAQKWRSAMSDFSVMLRQSYDGSSFEREARSADAVNVHIEQLLWNVTMCGTPDALYRVVNNYTDGFQSRIAVARTPDNTFSKLEDKPFALTDKQKERISQVAHLLPLIAGDIVLPKIEAKAREWVEEVRLQTMKDDDRVMARQRFRVCVTAMRMTCCLMLCRVCEKLLSEHGLAGAEKMLMQQPDYWKQQILYFQTPQMLKTYEVIADSLMDNALHFFRDRIEAAFSSREYVGNTSERSKRGKNDSIFERLDVQFTFEQAFQQSRALKGLSVSRNTVSQMLRRWEQQGLITRQLDGNIIKRTTTI